MSTTGKRIKFLRENKSLTQKELAIILGVTRDVVANWETDRGIPNPEILPKLSKYFEISIDALLGTRDESGIVSKLPVLGAIRAGLPILADENIEGYLEVPESIRADYVLQVTGDSMIGAGILDGDYAVCRQIEAPQSGQIIVALKDEGSISEATLKYYFNGSGEPKLKAANPAYADIDYRDGYRCAGQLVAVVREDAPGYQTYKDFLAVKDNEEWTEVINIATSYGLSPQEVINILEAQWKMLQKLKG